MRRSAASSAMQQLPVAANGPRQRCDHITSGQEVALAEDDNICATLKSPKSLRSCTRTGLPRGCIIRDDHREVDIAVFTGITPCLGTEQVHLNRPVRINDTAQNLRKDLGVAGRHVTIAPQPAASVRGQELATRAGPSSKPPSGPQTRIHATEGCESRRPREAL